LHDEGHVRRVFWRRGPEGLVVASKAGDVKDAVERLESAEVAFYEGVGDVAKGKVAGRRAWPGWCAGFFDDAGPVFASLEAEVGGGGVDCDVGFDELEEVSDLGGVSMAQEGRRGTYARRKDHPVPLAEKSSLVADAANDAFCLAVSADVVVEVESAPDPGRLLLHVRHAIQRGARLLVLRELHLEFTDLALQGSDILRAWVVS
jgi:hypothetical protein